MSPNRSTSSGSDCISADSVISSSIQSGSASVSSKASRKRGMNDARPNSMADTLTAMVSPSIPSLAHTRHCRKASRMTQLPRSSMRPLDSAWGTKLSGINKPRWGCCQRTSASTPVTAPDRQLTCGW